MLFVNVMARCQPPLTPAQEALAQLKAAIFFRRSDKQIAAFGKALRLGVPIGQIRQAIGEVIDYFVRLAKTKIFIEQALERALQDI